VEGEGRRRKEEAGRRKQEGGRKEEGGSTFLPKLSDCKEGRMVRGKRSQNRTYWIWGSNRCHWKKIELT
jgi:hypothetical protein